MLGKKELTVMEWAKRNMHEREKAETENGELEGKRVEQEKEEEELEGKVRRERRREVDELAKKAKMAGREMNEMWRIENGGRPSIDVTDSTQFHLGGRRGRKGESALLSFTAY